MRFDPGDYRHQSLAILLFLPFLWCVRAIVGPIDQFSDDSKQHIYVGLASVVGLVGGANLVGRSTQRKRQEDLVRRVRRIVPEFEQPWLYSEAKLIEFEGFVKTRTIWVITPDLSKDGDPGESAFQRVVGHNIRRGVHYTYVYPDNDITRARAVAVRRLFQHYPEQLQCCAVPVDDFARLSISHMVLYNPSMEESCDAVTAFLEAPVGGPPHWLRIQHRDATVSLVGRYARILEMYPVKKGVT